MVYLEATIQGFFLKIILRFRYTWGISVGVSFPVMLQAVCLPFWSEVASFMGVSQVFCLFYCFVLCERLFGGTNPGGCFIILSALFILILHGRKMFSRVPIMVGFLINNWYCVSCLLNINSALAL